MRKLPIFFVLIVSVGACDAQWMNRKTPGVPRLENGAPDPMAAAPRRVDGKPDLNGLWWVAPNSTGSDFMRDLKPDEIAPWARALHRERVDNYMIDSPHTRCLPIGPQANLVAADPMRIVQTPEMIVLLNGDATYRQIFMDGRELEVDPEPSWMGYSVGRWDGDVLVVETNGFNDRTWLDPEGHPHSTKLRMTERFRRTSFGSIDLEVVFTDPSIYEKPIHVKTILAAAVDTGQLEYVCAENEKDAPHFTGNMSDAPTFVLSKEELATYAGTYVPIGEFAGQAPPLPIEVMGDALRLTHPLFGPALFRPVAPGRFSGTGLTIIFGEKDGRMTVSAQVVEGLLVAERQETYK